METVRVTPGMFPPTINTTPNSPMVCAKLRTNPASNPAHDCGTITRKKVSQEETPSVHAASINFRSTVRKAEAMGCTVKGMLYKVEATTRPSKVNGNPWPTMDAYPRPNGLSGPMSTRM